MDYASAKAWWFSQIDYERRPARPGELSLDRMRDLLSRLGDPHLRLPIIHVAGSKGKGSTAAMIESIGRASGLLTGLYTSPHLVDVRERVRVAGESISEAEAADVLTRIREASLANAPPTFFEIATALGFLHFADVGVRLAVVEVGLGGRFDATNVCHPLVSVITSISLEHTAILGDTDRLIAFEKCGIIKPGVPVVSGATNRDAAEVIRNVARERGCPLTEVVPVTDQRLDVSCESYVKFDHVPGLVEPSGEISPARLVLDDKYYSIGLLGKHQAANAAVAVTACRAIRDRGIAIPESTITAGLAKARWPARMEVFRGPPLTILDSAHNVDSAQSLLQTLLESLPPLPVTLLYASSSDKDVRGILHELLPSMSRVVVTQFTRNPRAVPPASLGGMARGIRPELPLAVVDDPVAALEMARRDAELLLVCGSVYLAGELRELLR
ncbi:MAG: bifunctional folylpolyglutamate synthase/dihydrofolate synthase [Gemmataceae bacterium]|nr:bifunctional folylpolyglutamate synthase/dihydrofolate synthase [Gemmataceae bacterium]